MNTGQIRERPSDVLTSVTVGVRDVVILGMAFVVLGGLVVFLADHYRDPKNDLAAFGVVLPVIATLTGFAFGASVGAAAGSSAGKAAAKAAEGQTDEKRAQAQTALEALRAAIPQLDELSTELARLPSPAGETSFVIAPDLLPEGSLTIRGEPLVAARQRLAAAEGALAAVVS